ncbi:MAG: hypothetical protein WBJ13_06190 [Sedimentibacter sp.]
MINNGVTAFADHYFSEESIYKAAENTGIRADIAPTISGLAYNYKEQLIMIFVLAILALNIFSLTCFADETAEVEKNEKFKVIGYYSGDLFNEP